MYVLTLLFMVKQFIFILLKCFTQISRSIFTIPNICWLFVYNVLTKSDINLHHTLFDRYA